MAGFGTSGGLAAIRDRTTKGGPDSKPYNNPKRRKNFQLRGLYSDGQLLQLSTDIISLTP
jgi:hypothetical protein